jgi:hypothetical protein
LEFYFTQERREQWSSKTHAYRSARSEAARTTHSSSTFSILPRSDTSTSTHPLGPRETAPTSSVSPNLTLRLIYTYCYTHHTHAKPTMVNPQSLISAPSVTYILSMVSVFTWPTKSSCPTAVISSQDTGTPYPTSAQASSVVTASPSERSEEVTMVTVTTTSTTTITTTCDTTSGV